MAFFDTRAGLGGAREVKPSLVSKANFCLQIALIAAALTSAHAPWAWPGVGGVDALCWGVAGTTLWSGLEYLNTDKHIKEASDRTEAEVAKGGTGIPSLGGGGDKKDQ